MNARERFGRRISDTAVEYGLELGVGAQLGGAAIDLATEGRTAGRVGGSLAIGIDVYARSVDAQGFTARDGSYVVSTNSAAYMASAAIQAGAVALGASATAIALPAVVTGIAVGYGTGVALDRYYEFLDNSYGLGHAFTRSYDPTTGAVVSWEKHSIIGTGWINGEFVSILHTEYSSGGQTNTPVFDGLATLANMREAQRAIDLSVGRGESGVASLSADGQGYVVGTGSGPYAPASSP